MGEPVLRIGDWVSGDGTRPQDPSALVRIVEECLEPVEAKRARRFRPVGIAVPFIGIVAAVVDRDRVLNAKVRELADAAMLRDAAEVELPCYRLQFYRDDRTREAPDEQLADPAAKRLRRHDLSL